MFLHIGSDILVNKNQIIMILNISEQTNYLALNNKKNTKVIVSELECKSCIVTDNNIIYFSPISTTTLQKRLKKYL